MILLLILFHPSLCFDRPVTGSAELNAVCPTYRKNVACDDLTLLKIRERTKNFQCIGCKRNLELLLCETFCKPRPEAENFVLSLSPVFCAAGQLACEDANFCRSNGPVSKAVAEISGKPASVEIRNDFSLMPVSAECGRLVPAEPEAPKEKRNSGNRIWIIFLGGVLLGAWITSRRNRARKAVPGWHRVEPEESSRL